MKTINGYTLTQSNLEDLCQKHLSVYPWKEAVEKFYEHNWSGGGQLKEVSVYEVNGPDMPDDEIKGWLKEETGHGGGVSCLICLLQIKGVLPKDKPILMYV